MQSSGIAPQFSDGVRKTIVTKAPAIRPAPKPAAFKLPKLPTRGGKRGK